DLIKRIAHDRDSSCRYVHRMQRNTLPFTKIIMRLDENRVGKDRREVPMHERPELRDLFRWKLLQRAARTPDVPLGRRLTETEIADRIDIDRGLAVPEQIVQEAAHPGVAGLRIRGKPDQGTHDSIPRASFYRKHL